MRSFLYLINWKSQRVFFLFDFCIAEPDSPPQNVELINVTATEINLRWLPPEQPNGLITHYEVLYSDSNDLFIKNASSTSMSLSKMKPYTLYNISVRAFTRLGHGNQSSFPLLVRTSETGEYIDFLKKCKFSTAFYVPEISLINFKSMCLLCKAVCLNPVFSFIYETKIRK